MGLDVYLYTREQAEQNATYSAAWDRYYKLGDDVTEEVKAAIKAEAEAVPAYSHQQDVPSEKHPKHLFNRRYLRSSYNGSGFNRAVPDFLADEDTSLYDIFRPLFDVAGEPDGDLGDLDAAHIPALQGCRKRAADIAERLTSCNPLRVEALHGPILGTADHLWNELPTEEQVLAWYRQCRPEDKGSGGYSSAKGTVFGGDGLSVLAITVCRDVLGCPAPAIVYRGDATSYVQGAEIVVEFCDEAISLIERDGGCRISWSG
jgi:hypothetical protein